MLSMNERRLEKQCKYAQIMEGTHEHKLGNGDYETCLQPSWPYTTKIDPRLDSWTVEKKERRTPDRTTTIRSDPAQREFFFFVRIFFTHMRANLKHVPSDRSRASRMHAELSNLDRRDMFR